MLRKVFTSCALGFAPAIVFGAICVALSAPIHVTVGGLIYGTILGATSVAKDFVKEPNRKKSMRFKVSR